MTAWYGERELIGAPLMARRFPSIADHQHLLLPAACVLLDVVTIPLVVWAAAWLRHDFPFSGRGPEVDTVVVQVAAPMAMVWLIALGLLGAYRMHHLESGIELYKNVVNASAMTAGIVAIVCYLGRFPLSRGFFVMSFLIGVPLLVLERLAVRKSLHRARSSGQLQLRVLVAGEASHVDELTSVLSRESWLGYDVVGALSPGGASDPAPRTARTPGGLRYLGSADQAADIARDGTVDAIIMARGAYASSAAFRRAQWSLEELRVEVIVAPDVTDVAAERVSIRPVAGLPLVHLDRPARQDALRGAKRAFDIVGSLALIVLTAPLMLAAALRVHAHDGGPVLFKQYRVGREGQSFSMLKFRTMVVDAEDRLTELVRERAAVTGADGAGNEVLFKMNADPRITRPGRWLRRFSVDELPQLFNVLLGEMSLVGPRPALGSEVATYDDDAARRLRVRPGLTGLWQVSGRSDLAWDETVRLDLFYVDNWSMVRDVVIVARTLRAVFSSRGAY